MTTLYQSYLTALQEGTINLNDVNFSCLGVGEYEPNSEHTLADLVGNEETPGLADIKVTIDNALVGDIEHYPMAQVIEILTPKFAEQAVEGIKMYVLFSGENLCFAEEI